jgi:hypothetical protein
MQASVRSPRNLWWRIGPWRLLRRAAAAEPIVLGVLCLVVALAGCRASAVDTAAVQIGEVAVGFNGRYKVGLFTPVAVTLTSPQRDVRGQVKLVTHDGDGVLTEFPGPTVVLGQGETVVARWMARFGRLSSGVRVTFTCDDGSQTTRVVGAESFPQALDSSQQLIVQVGSNAALAQALTTGSLPGEMHVARVDDVRALPEQWCGYEAVDWLMLNTGAPELYGALTPESPQAAALDAWLRRGGRLMLFAGRNAEALLGSGGRLASFVPGTFQEMAPLSGLTQLEAYSGGAAIGGPRDQRLEAPRLREVRGVQEVRQDNVPLVVRSAHGLGEVVFVGLDFDLPPLATWERRGEFLARLLTRGDRGSRQSDGGTIGARLTHLGIVDLAGQLRGALDQFQGVQVNSFLLVALLGLGYLLLIGPADYFVLKRLLRRMEWTWVSFPLLACGFLVLAWLLTRATLGQPLQVNQAEVVDIDMAVGLTRGTTWFNVYSPRGDAYDLRLEVHPPTVEGPAPRDVDVILSWWGLPGSGLGGMSSPHATAAAAPLKGTYAHADELSRLQHVPLRVRSSQSFVARWSTPGAAGLAIDVHRSADGLPRGTITNMLDVPLRQCLLAYGNWSYTLEELAPGQTVVIERDLQRRELVDELQGRFLAVFDDRHLRSQTLSREYNPRSLEVPYILRQMMFYQASGGAEYTGLQHRYQPFVDLTGQLHVGRGIFVGLAEQPASTVAVERDGHRLPAPGRQWTYYRWVFSL